MKRTITLLLALVLVVVSFASCSQPAEEPSAEKQESETAAPTEAAKEEAAPAEFSYPMDGQKLTYWVPLASNAAPNYASFDETPFYEEYQKVVGVDLEFMHPPQGNDQAKEQLNLIIASGDLPDIMEFNWVTSFPGGPGKLLNDGIATDITDLVPENAPLLAAVLEANPEAQKQVKTDEGQIYCFPFLRVEDDLRVFFGPMVREDWLNDLGLDVPETMEDWYTVLTAFKEEKGAVAPLTYQWNFMNNANTFVGAYGIANDFYVDGGEVKFGPVEPAFKDFMKEYAKWYDEGLIDADIATIDRNQCGTKMTDGQAGASLGFTASRMGAWMQSMADVDPNYSLVGTPHPVLNEGDTCRFGQKSPYYIGVSSIITTACEDVDVAMRALDYAYGEEGHMLFNFGIEGVSYNMVDGYPKYSDEIFNDPEGVPVNQAMARYARSNSNGPFIQDKRYFEQYMSMEQQKDAVATWSVSDVDTYGLPPITPTTEESQEYATIMNEINTYREEMFLKFLFGQEDIDAMFDKYVENIENMGLARAIEIQQGALERYNNR